MHQNFSCWHICAPRKFLLILAKVEFSAPAIDRIRLTFSFLYLEQPQAAQTEEGEDRFATIRPANVVARQQQEHQGNDEYREQLMGYKRLRQQHQRQIVALEQKQKYEMDEHRRALEKEFEAQMHSFDKEMEKLKGKHRQELEQKVNCRNHDILSALFTLSFNLLVNRDIISSNI